MTQEQKPVFLKNKDEAPANAEIIDIFHSALRELFYIRNPHLKSNDEKTQEQLGKFLNNSDIKDVWIYFSWNNKLIHLPEENVYFEIRTNRNLNIINKEEQRQFRKAIVGIAGLSTGSNILSSLVISGGPKILKIGDFDILEISNMNRIRTSIANVGMNKTLIAAHQVWEIDPFADLSLFENGLTKENLEEFLIGSPKLDIFIDAMDNLELKFLSRFIAKKHGIPVLMFTDNGDGIIVDIERFDLEPQREIFHGRVADLKSSDLIGLSPLQWLDLATKIVGADYLTLRMQDSLLEIGKTIATVPRLGTTSNIDGAVAAFIIRRIVNNQEMPSGRYLVSLEEKFIPRYLDAEEVERRRLKFDEFKQKFAKK